MAVANPFGMERPHPRLGAEEDLMKRSRRRVRFTDPFALRARSSGRLSGLAPTDQTSAGRVRFDGVGLFAN